MLPNKTKTRLTETLTKFVIFTSLLTFGRVAMGYEVTFVFDYPVELATPSREGLSNKKSFATGEAVVIKSTEAQWIQAKGKIPVVLLPVSLELSMEPRKLELPEVATWPPQAIEQEVDRKVTALMDGIVEFQAALARKDVTEAERILVRLETIQPISYFHFLRGSLSFAKGDIEKAKESIRTGLQRQPANEQGREFLKRLEGGKR